jgi:hypothetical protein
MDYVLIMAGFSNDNAETVPLHLAEDYREK